MHTAAVLSKNPTVAAAAARGRWSHMILEPVSKEVEINQLPAMIKMRKKKTNSVCIVLYSFSPK